MKKQVEFICESCRKKFKTGDLAVQVREGIVGVLGFVQLDEKPMAFCNLACLKKHLSKSGEESDWLPRRIP